MVATPATTRIALLATLALTLGAAGDFVRRAPENRIDPDLAGRYLAFFGALFCLRVAGQLVVLRAAPRGLPPMGQWNLMPYRFLLPIQLGFVALIAAIVVEFVVGPWVFAEPTPDLGLILVAFSFVYAGSMAVRYAVRMTRKREERWFGGTIPMVFHVVLAAFLFVWGTYHASY